MPVAQKGGTKQQQKKGYRHIARKCVESAGVLLNFVQE